jgi:ribosomal protein S18 acetylase RimI-like enzyme
MHPLDNPIWQALTTCQAQFAETRHSARRFPPSVTSLGAIEEPTQAGYESLAHLLGAGEMTGLLLEALPAPPANWAVVEAVPLLQMVQKDCEIPSPLPELIELTEADASEMMALADLTKPGPFGRRTHELGAYLGIRRMGSLVAMGGERLRVPGYTEISAVCTHPNHTGHGYATALIVALVKRIRDRNQTPFLHVRPENKRAVELYQRLGFRERRRLYLAVIRKSAW